jgi:exoribonuclease-2
VTGASAKGTWARIFKPPVEGKIERGYQGLDVGDRVRLRLIDTNPERGFIDFERI